MDVYIRDIGEEIKSHRGRYLFEGISFLVLGILAIMLPSVTTIAVMWLLGAILFAGGLLQTTTFFFYPQRRWKLFSGLLSLFAGLGIIVFPMVGLFTLAIFIGIFLLLEAFFEILFSLAFKPFPGWRWMMLCGIITMLLAILVLAGFPTVTTFFLAIAVGLNMGLYGVSILLLVLDGTR